MVYVVAYIIALVLIWMFFHGATKDDELYDEYIRGGCMKILDIKSLKFDDTNCKVFVTFIVDVNGKKCNVKRTYDRYSDLTKVLKDGYVEFQ